MEDHNICSAKRIRAHLESSKMAWIPIPNIIIDLDNMPCKMVRKSSVDIFSISKPIQLLEEV